MFDSYIQKYWSVIPTNKKKNLPLAVSSVEITEKNPRFLFSSSKIELNKNLLFHQSIQRA